MKIGNIEIKNNVFLAPMAGWTDYAYRTICVEHGAGLVTTEMISALGLHYLSKNTAQLLKTDCNEKPVAVQIFGSKPEIMKEACENELLQKFDIIDINMGCPVPKVVKNGEGSALMKDLILSEKIINACKKATTKPITIKCRLGFENDNHNVKEFAKMCEGAGADAITIHGRTRNQFYSGTANLDEIFEVAEILKIPVIANGDIKSIEDYEKIMKSNCAGVAIGRASIGNPAIFCELTKNKLPYDKNTLLKHHCQLLKENYNEHYALVACKKNLVFYISNIPNASQYKNQIFQAQSIDEALQIALNALNQ